MDNGYNSNNYFDGKQIVNLPPKWAITLLNVCNTGKLWRHRTLIDIYLHVWSISIHCISLDMVVSASK